MEAHGTPQYTALMGVFFSVPGSVCLSDGDMVEREHEV